MTTRLAACNCGQLKIRARGEPTRVSVCHCPGVPAAHGQRVRHAGTIRAGQCQYRGHRQAVGAHARQCGAHGLDNRQPILQMPSPSRQARPSEVLLFLPDLAFSLNLRQLFESSEPSGVST